MSARDAIQATNEPYQWFPGAPEAARSGLAVNDKATLPLCFPGLLAAEECEAILRLSRPHPSSMNALNNPTEGYRYAESRWIFPEPDWTWVFRRVEAIFAEANRYFQFDVQGFVDPLLVATYPEGGGFDWHVDALSGMTATRKISLSVQLTDRDAYEGGELEFAGHGVLPLSRGIGTAICFPAFACHKVNPVRRGTREVLVTWAHGPTFR